MSLDMRARNEVARWLTDYLSRLFGTRVDPAMPFEQLGLDSAGAAELSADLASWLGCRIDPAIAYEHDSIAALADALAADPQVHACFAKREPQT